MDNQMLKTLFTTAQKDLPSYFGVNLTLIYGIHMLEREKY